MRYDEIVLQRAGKTPIYQQLVDVLQQAIVTRDLEIGQRLLPERKLADLLRVSRNTVITCYRELEARGLVHRHVGMGSFVAAEHEPTAFGVAWQNKLGKEAQQPIFPHMFSVTRDLTQADAVSFAIGQPALDHFPTERFTTAFMDIMASSPFTALEYGPIEGMPELREAISKQFGMLSTRTMVVSGSRQGLDLIAQSFLDPGDAVIIDRPGFRGAIEVLSARGARLIGWDLARADFTELEDLVLRFRPKLLYTNPTYSNPTGVLLSLSQRQTLLDLAGRYRIPIIEDEPYQLLYFHTPPPPSLQQLDKHDLVVHLGTFSKVLGPGLRLGWISGPPTILHQLALIKQRRAVHTPNVTQLLVAELFRNRTFDDHVRGMRAEHLARYQAMLTAIETELPTGALRFDRPKGGLYLWIRLSERISANYLLRVATRYGVAFAPGGLFYTDGSGGNELRLCFSATTASQIRLGIQRFAAALDVVSRMPPPSR